MTGTHVVPDRQQYIELRQAHVVPDRQLYDEHTPITSCERRYDTRCISYQTALPTSIRRLPAHPTSALTIHRRKIQYL